MPVSEDDRLRVFLAIGDDFVALVDRWIAQAVETCGKAEAASLRSVVGRLKRAFGDTATTELTPLLIRSYLQARLDAGLSPRTVSNHAKTLRRVLGYACDLGLRPDNPAQGVTVPKPHAGVLGPSDTIGGPTAGSVGPCRPKRATSRPKADRASPPNKMPGQPKQRPQVISGWQELRLGDAWGPSDNDIQYETAR